MMTVKDVAKMLSVTERTIYRKIENAKLPHHRIGSNGEYRFDRDEVVKWMEKYSRR